MEWNTYDNGASIGQRGSEDGVILYDDEHSLGARITLEQGGGIAPFSITCGIYGWTFHTRFFGSQQESEIDYEHMKNSLTDILNIIQHETDAEGSQKMAQISDAISKFVDRYP